MEKENKKLVINFLATIIQLCINYGISLLFVPYLVSTVGSEAYGFVNLANSMVNYATIITIALSSVAGRFITINIHQKKNEEANQYFNSTLIANLLIAVIVGIIFVPIIINLQNILQIPENLIISVKLLFIFVVLNFMITVASNVFTVGTFITNKLYLTNIGNCISALIRVLLLWGMFGILPPKVFYISIASCITSIFLAIYNASLTMYLKTNLKINIKKFSLSKIIEMITSGIWSSITKLSQVLSDGIDMLISNIFIGSYAMGQLSIAYTISTLFSSLLTNIVSIFNPKQTYYYAKGDIKSVVNEIKLNMKMTGFFMAVFFSGIIVFGRNFFSLWVPNENIPMIYTISCISIITILTSGVGTSLDSVFLITNHLKENSIVWLMNSFINCIIVFGLVTGTNLGVYAVAGVSKISAMILYITFTPLYACKCLKISKMTFYPIMIKYIASSIVLTIFMFAFKSILPEIISWKCFFIECGLVGVCACGLNSIIFLNRDERSYLVNTLKQKVLHKSK